MSKITEAFNAMHSRIEILHPNHKRLSDPYDLEKNTELFLRKGYGIALLSGDPVNEGILAKGCNRTTTRDFDIHITRQFFAKENDGPKKDVVALQILEDLAIITSDFLLEETLNDGTIDTDFNGDTGIFKVVNDKDNFIAATATITVRYRDTL